MKRLLPVFIILSLLLTGCGRKKTDADSYAQPEGTQPSEIISVTPVPEEYNTIDKLSVNERKQMQSEILDIAENCRDIYTGADKGDTFNRILPDESVNAMISRIAELGYPARDYAGKVNMQGIQPLLDFGYALFSSDDISGGYCEVYDDGRITFYKLNRMHGEWELITMSVDWDKSDKPYIYTEGQYAINDVQFTAKGWLIYSRDYSGLGSSSSKTGSYIFVRVKPVDETMSYLCRRYIEPIGYLENNLFTTTWNEGWFTPIDFNSLYAQLFAGYNGLSPLTASNMFNYYKQLEGTNLCLVPTETFERTVQYYFNISADALKGISDYSAQRGGYYFLGYDRDYYTATPRTPVPEVIDYWYNGDGTLTMRVDAVNMWYGTDQAFTHEVTIRDEGNGLFKYVSNRLYESENNILPEAKLGYLLEAEEAKLK